MIGRLTDVKKNTEVIITTEVETPTEVGKDTQTELEEDMKTATTPPQLDIHQEEIIVIADKTVKDMKTATSTIDTAAVLVEDTKSAIIPAAATSTQQEVKEEIAVPEATLTEVEEDMMIRDIPEVEDMKKTVTPVVQENTMK